MWLLLTIKKPGTAILCGGYLQNVVSVGPWENIELGLHVMEWHQAVPLAICYFGQNLGV
jgi:hypothetical protein